MVYSKFNPKGGKWLQRGAIACTITISLIFSFWITKWKEHVADTEYRERLLYQAMTVAQTINVERVKNLTFTLADKTNPHFIRLRDQMRAYSEVLLPTFGDTKYIGIYSMTIRDGSIIFGPESIDEKDIMSSPPGTVYKEPPGKLRDVFQSRVPQTVGPYTDEYGTFVSAFAPVIDTCTNEIVLVIGIDIMATQWQMSIVHERIVMILFTMLFMLTLIAGGVLLHWRNRFPAKKQWLLRNAESLVTASVGLVITVILAYLAHENESSSRSQSFWRMAVAETHGFLDTMQDIRQYHLGGTVHFFESSQYVDRQEFHSYTKDLSHGGEQVWGWILSVNAKEKPVVEHQAHTEGVKDFAIWQKGVHDNPTPAVGRDTYYPVYYLEPPSVNKYLLGYDIGSDPVQREVIEEASRTGLVKATYPIIPEHETWSRIGGSQVYVYWPVFTKSPPARLQGFIMVVLDVQVILEQAVSKFTFRHADLIIDIHQLKVGTHSLHLSSTSPELSKIHQTKYEISPDYGTDLSVMIPLFIFGNAYAIVSYPSPTYLGLYPVRAVWITAFWGGLLTALLTMFVGFLSNRKFYLEQQVQERTTELKSSELRYREAAALADKANMAKSEFLAKMSHELRTPLNGIIGMTTLLMDTKLTTEQHQHLEIVRSSSESLLSIINDILDFSQIETHKIELESLYFDLRAIMKDTAEMLTVKAQEKGLKFACLVDPDVPSFIIGDQGRLRQVLDNLGKNAVKFTHTGMVTIHICMVEETADRVKLRFEVKDTGIGIPKDKVAILFLPFIQVDGSTTRKYRGTGLGLTISKQLVELMGGDIGVESEEGKGSNFWFTLTFEKRSVSTSIKPFVPSSCNDPNIFDIDSLLKRVMGDKDLAREIICIFLKDIPTTLKDIRSFFTRGDIEKLWKMAYKIRGSTSSVSGKAMYNKAFEIENAGRARDIEKLSVLIPELEEQFNLLKVAMEGWKE